MKKKVSILGVLLLMFLPVRVSAQEAYAVHHVYSGWGESTLTFYYDNDKSSREGTVYNLNSGYEVPGWTPEGASLSMRRILSEMGFVGTVEIVFDSSFKNYKPSTTYCWFGKSNDYFFYADYVQGIDNFDTSEVQIMANMFEHFYGVNCFLNKFNTSSCVDMHDMFLNGYDDNIDVSNFDTSNCTNMSGMFKGCKYLSSLDVSNFDTSNCTNMTEMFANCSGLQSLSISSTMTNLPEGACSGIGSSNPCAIIAPEGFDFGVDTSGDSFTWKGGIFKIKRPVVLDEDDLDLPEATDEKVDVKVKRTIKSSAVNTLCLPFDMSKSQMVEIFGDDCYLLDISTSCNVIESVGPDGEYQSQTNIKFEQISENLSAGIPYLLITEKNMTEFDVKDVVIKPKAYYVNSKLESDYGEIGRIKFHGVLKNMGLLPVGSLFLKDDNYYLSDGTATIKGFRGYFDVVFYGEEDFSNMNFTLDLSGLGDELNIDQLEFNGKTYNFGKVYSINGTYLGLAEKVMDKLPRGIYIINNKKVIVK